jgi:hypothetical protein
MENLGLKGRRERNNEITNEKEFGGLRNLGLHSNNMTEIKTWWGLF